MKKIMIDKQDLNIDSPGCLFTADKFHFFTNYKKYKLKEQTVSGKLLAEGNQQKTITTC